MSSQKWESKIPDGKRVQPSCSSSATNGHTLWVKNMRYCSEFMVRNLWFLVPLPLVLSLWIRYEKVINWKLCFQNDKVFTRMMMFSLKPLFEPKKMPFDDFLMTTWERKNENERKNEQEILCQWLLWNYHWFGLFCQISVEAGFTVIFWQNRPNQW